MKQRVLVADDMSMDREVLSELLEGDFDVTAVADGGEAIRQLDANPGRFACILLDIFMPVADGFAVLRHMKENGYDTPVIALTSLTDSEGHIRCYEAGVTELLEKPYDRKVLLYKVKRVIGGRSEEPRAGGDSAAKSEVAVSGLLLKAFRSDFSMTLANLRQAIADHDDAGLHAAAHALKGLEANLGVLIDG